MQINWTTQVHSPKEGVEGGYSTKFYTRKDPPRGPTLCQLLYTIFWQKRYPLQGNDMPFRYLINAASLLTVGNALSFKYEILYSGQRSAVSEHDGRVFLLALPTWHNFSRKSYFFFYKLIKQVTNNVFKKREGSGGEGFWGVCTPPCAFLWLFPPWEVS